ncbi:MAG TPA: hypothetical protein VF167_02955 [Longimicrobiaceae bacterium]
MAFLSIPGFAAVPIALDRAERLEPEVVGDLMTTFSGKQRSGIRGRVREWRFTTTPLPPADARALYFALTSRPTITVSGDALDGETVTCRASVQAESYVLAGGEKRRAVTFTLREATPLSPVLFTFQPGDLGYTFSRASAATYRSQAGLITSAASGTLRDSHYALNPDSELYERATLIEPERTNLILHSEDFSNAAWFKSPGITVSANSVTAPDGNAAADTLANDGSGPNKAIYQIFTTNASAVRYSISVWLKAGTLDKAAIGIRDNTADSWTAQTGRVISGPGEAAVSSSGRIDITGLSTTEWTRVAVSMDEVATATNTLRLILYPGGTDTATGNLYAWGAQAEAGAFATSYIATTSATVARSADALKYAFTAAPQAMTLYARFIEQGTLRSANSARILQISDSTSASTSRLLIHAPSGDSYYQIYHGEAGGQVTSTLAAAPDLGDLVELRGILYADGSVRLHQSINGAAETSSTASSALALASAWDDETLNLGGVGSSFVGSAAFTHVAVLKGERTLSECRGAAGVL